MCFPVYHSLHYSHLSTGLSLRPARPLWASRSVTPLSWSLVSNLAAEWNGIRELSKICLYPAPPLPPPAEILI